MSATVQPPTSSASGSPQPKSKNRRRIAWSGIAIFILLAGIAIYATLHQGVKTIDFKQGTISFQTLHTATIKKNQTIIKYEFTQARARAQQQSQPATPQVPDIAGYWYASSGLTYYIEQYGSSAVMEEESPYGVTGVAEGVVYSSQADFDFRAVDGSTGQAVLYFVNNSTMDASFRNNTYGTTSQFVMSRQ